MQTKQLSRDETQSFIRRLAEIIVARNHDRVAIPRGEFFTDGASKKGLLILVEEDFVTFQLVEETKC